MLRRFSNILILIIILIFGSRAFSQTELKIGGMTLVAQRDSFLADPFPALKTINVGWVAIVPYAFTPGDEAKVYYGNNHQWWGETPDGVSYTIKLAKENGLKIMLKPQLWIHDKWVGDLEYRQEREWQSWESDYRDYILSFARIAERTGVELFCIGTEFKKSLQQREPFWRQLIKDVRLEYSGLITYCSNWDEFESIQIWDDLDVIGVSAYFPLCEDKMPNVDALQKLWQPIKKRFHKLSKAYKKQILFTEYGYLSVDGCTGKTWELEKRRKLLPQNELAQSNALEAIYSVFCDEDFWAGGFLWKWYPNNQSPSEFRQKGYTPQGKLSESTIKKWYGDFTGNEKNKISKD